MARWSFLVVGAVALAGVGTALGLEKSQQANPDSSQAAGADYKITPQDLERKNPEKSTPEGLAEARKVFGYDCAMCHGDHGDGKGDVVESMKLTMHDWRDGASLAGKSDGEIFYIITKGKGKMMGEGERQSEKLRWNLVNLVRAMAAKGGAPKGTAAAANPS